MEQERLARLKRRAHNVLDDDTASRVKRNQTSSTVPHLPVNSKSDQAPKSTTHLNIKPDKSRIPFPRGTIRKTFSPCHRREGDIKIEEVLLKDKLKIGVFSSFMWEVEWLISKLNINESRLFMAMMSKPQADQEKFKKECEANTPPTVRLFWPPMDGAGNMHSKYMLLVFPEFLRIVITSANLTPFDWGETGVLENVVFLIDLPRLENEESTSRENLTPFGKELLYFLEKSKAPDQVLNGMLKFDFAATSDLAFVHSVGGSSFGADLNRTGFNGLARAINELNLAPRSTENLRLEYATASLGAMNDALLRSLHNAALGIYDKGTTTRSKATTLSDTKKRDFIRVYFPSHATVESSLGGTDSAGTICLREDWYRKGTFPKDVLRDHLSTRQGLLSHSKVLLGHCNSAAWVYIGSHNLSESAWGKLSKDRLRNEQKMVCRNWECGVLIPVHRMADRESEKSVEAVEHSPKLDLRSIFRPILDIPFEVPGPAYDTKPWFFDPTGHHKFG
jgi:hypothetical protein